MNITIKQKVLEKMYALYEDFVDDNDFVCQKHCAHCCTQNITMTTLEGYFLLNNLTSTTRTQLIQKLEPQEKSKRFTPRITINGMADLCARNQELPKEENDEISAPCPALNFDLCSLYSKRPFGCRCMVSRKNCGSVGYAEMPSWVISVNNVLMQYIEHIDAKGFSGNFTDIILFLNDPKNGANYVSDHLGVCQRPLLNNQPLYILMVPPEDRPRIEPLIKAIRSIKIDSVS
jgi:Fe-S-cluster containining protein